MKRIPVRQRCSARRPPSATRSRFGARFRVVFGPTSNRFGSSVHEIRAFAGRMGGIGQLEISPKDWKEIVTPSVANSLRS